VEREHASLPAVSFRGGSAGALAPFVVFLAGVAWLAWSGAPDERGFWPLLVAAIGVGLALARDRRAYAAALTQGMSQPIVALMILAWLLAGLLAQVLHDGGFVTSVIWLGAKAGLGPAGFVVASFLVCALVSTATGTSLGTLVLCAPLLYPAGAALGAVPAVLMGAILGGATFGDNISPVSDTTIASAGTQNAAIGDVVRSRLRYALPAAAVALVFFWLFAGDGAARATATAAELGNAAEGLRALPLLLAPLTALALLLTGRHLVHGLLAGAGVAAIVALVLGLLSFGDLLRVEAGSYRATGALVSGLERGVGVSVFTLLLMALLGGLEASGFLESLLAAMESRARSAAAAEWTLFAAISAAVLITTHSVVALLAVGPLARRTGSRLGISPTRRANLLDLTVCTYPFLLPYCIPTVLAASLTAGSGMGGEGVPPLSAWTIGAHNFHSWALLVMTVLAILTGYGRRTDLPAESS
jgi:Na+/H+ antiporter NhaC